MPSTFEQLRTTSAGDNLKTLVDHLADNCRSNPTIVNALLYVYLSKVASEETRVPHTLGCCRVEAWDVRKHRGKTIDEI